MKITVSKIEAAKMLNSSLKEIKELIGAKVLRTEKGRVVLSDIERIKLERELKKRPTLAGRILNFFRGVR